jgi:hypothetical protein
MARGGTQVNRKEAEKARRERQVFQEFCTAMSLSVDPNSVASRRPPHPDLECQVGGRCRRVELVEVTDQQLARRTSVSLKTKRPTGGAFSQEEPLFRAFVQKAHQTYETRGAPFFLLAYYDKQPRPADVCPDLIRRVVGGVAQGMVRFEGWRGTWVYDTRMQRLLWAYPKGWRQTWSDEATQQP